MESLALLTGAPTVYREDNIRCISVVVAKIVTHRVKYIGILECFLQEQYYNGLFVPKYDNSGVML